MAYFETLTGYIDQVKAAADQIPEDRQQLLRQAATDLKEELEQRSQVDAIFICTHNSRRSHLSQIWAQLASWEYDLPIHCYSGGTEATAFYPSAVAALAAAGCTISREGEQNPCYTVRASSSQMIRSFSKRYDDEDNPSEGFVAFMTCSDADENCPVVTGASKRISLYYEDPKAYDGTDLEQQKYQERCFQIASEMYFMMSAVAHS